MLPIESDPDDLVDELEELFDQVMAAIEPPPEVRPDSLFKMHQAMRMRFLGHSWTAIAKRLGFSSGRSAAASMMGLNGCPAKAEYWRTCKEFLGRELFRYNIMSLPRMVMSALQELHRIGTNPCEPSAVRVRALHSVLQHAGRTYVFSTPAASVEQANNVIERIFGPLPAITVTPRAIASKDADADADGEGMGQESDGAAVNAEESEEEQRECPNSQATK